MGWIPRAVLPLYVDMVRGFSEGAVSLCDCQLNGVGLIIQGVGSLSAEEVNTSGPWSQ